MHIENLKRPDIVAFSRVARSIITTTKYYSPVARVSESKKYSPKQVLEDIADSSHIILVAKEEQRVVGFLHGHFNDGTFLIDWIGTHTASRGTRVASQLLNGIQKKIATRVHKIWCDTRTENKEAVRFFKKHGFKKVATLKDHWYRQDFFLWEKLL